MNDILGINKIINGMNQQDWQKRLADIVQYKQTQNAKSTDMTQGNIGALAQPSVTNKSFFNNGILNNLANGMGFQDALLKKPTEQFDALSKIFSLFKGV